MGVQANAMARRGVGGGKWGEEDTEDSGDEEWVDQPEVGIQTAEVEGSDSVTAMVKDGETDEAAVSVVRLAKYARLERRVTTASSNPWAVLEVPQGNEAQSGVQEEPSGNGVEKPTGEERPRPAGEQRPRLPGKLAGWSSAEQVVDALQAVGLPGSIVKTEDIRVRIEQPTQGSKPQYVLHYYPTTGAVLPQGKLAATVRARLAGWQAGRAQ